MPLPAWRFLKLSAAVLEASWALPKHKNTRRKGFSLSKLCKNTPSSFQQATTRCSVAAVKCRAPARPLASSKLLLLSSPRSLQALQAAPAA